MLATMIITFVIKMTKTNDSYNGQKHKIAIRYFGEWMEGEKEERGEAPIWVKLQSLVS